MTYLRFSGYIHEIALSAISLALIGFAFICSADSKHPLTKFMLYQPQTQFLFLIIVGNGDISRKVFSRLFFRPKTVRLAALFT